MAFLLNLSWISFSRCLNFAISTRSRISQKLDHRNNFTVYSTCIVSCCPLLQLPTTLTPHLACAIVYFVFVRMTVLRGEAAPAGCAMISLSDKLQVHVLVKVSGPVRRVLSGSEELGSSRVAQATLIFMYYSLCTVESPCIHWYAVLGEHSSLFVLW